MVRRTIALLVLAAIRPVHSTALLGRLTADVNPTTLLAANGMVRIGPSPGKGLGAFSARHLFPFYEIGRYKGVVLRGEDELHARYGENGGRIPEHKRAWHLDWKSRCEEQGVTTTGAYVVSAGKCPLTGESVYVDAEDVAHASWCRYLNHSQKRPNLSMGTAMSADGEPIVRFVVEREIQPGDELLFSYGENYWSDDPIEDS